MTLVQLDSPGYYSHDSGLIVLSHVDDVHTFKSFFVPGRYPGPFQVSGLGTNKRRGKMKKNWGKS